MIAATTILQFAVATLLPVIASVVLTLLDQRTSFGKLGYWTKQLIFGLVFGAIAIFGTEFGIDTRGATMNVRDAAPVAAGLFFGGPAGILAGLLGGIERWFSVLWGRGMFTRVACSVATAAAGLYAALLRRFLFEDRTPAFQHAVAISATAEVLHLLLVFLTNMDQTARAFLAVQACAMPMIGCNAISAGLCQLGVTLAGGARRYKKELPLISTRMQNGILGVIMVGLIASIAFAFQLQDSLSDDTAHETLSLELRDVQSDAYNATNAMLVTLARKAAEVIPDTAKDGGEISADLSTYLGVSEIHVVDKSGRIVASSNKDAVGYDLSSNEATSSLIGLIGASESSHEILNLDFGQIPEIQSRKLAAIPYEDGIIVVGYNDEDYTATLGDQLTAAVSSRHVGNEGMLAVFNDEGELLGTREDIPVSEAQATALWTTFASSSLQQGQSMGSEGTPSEQPGDTNGSLPAISDESLLLTTTQPEEAPDTNKDELWESVSAVSSEKVDHITFRETEYLAMQSKYEGFKLVALLPASESEFSRDLWVLVTSFMETLVFAAIFAAIYLLIRNIVVRGIDETNNTLTRITDGDLEQTVEVRDSVEFSSLSDGINATVGSLKKAIAAEAARIDRDLATARAIQEGALPSTFPPFPEIDAFDIYASMDPAREVGGDFYDFFLVNDHTLCMVIADVSGKGIPAALFMMAAKAEIANNVQAGMGIAESIQTANWHLYQGNDACMFVTVWAALLDWQSNTLTYVNAGHNPPLLRRSGTWHWLTRRGGLLMGLSDTTKYTASTLDLQEGDELFLYTDGVNEAFNADQEQFGNERLEAVLTENTTLHPRELVNTLRRELREWSKDAEQSDDITMLSVELGVPPEATASITLPATIDNLDEVLAFVHDELARRRCPITTQKQIDVALEELFVNVCHYAYANSSEPGNVQVEYAFNTNPNALTISLTDWGIPFDPLEREDPKVPETIQEAKIGGLGIYLVKKLTDDLSYLRDGGSNITAFRKSW